MEKQFEKLEELVKDEDTIVTAPSYAVKACIPYEESCRLIHKFYEINKGSNEIHPTFVLTGVRKSDGRLTVVQVNEDSISEEKDQFEDDFIESVFSIQKAKDVNYNIISLIEPVDGNTEADVSNLGAIIGKNCVKRKLCKKVLPTLPPATVKGKSSIFTKQNSLFKSKSNSEDVKNEEKASGPTSEPTPNKVQPQGSIANLFNKAAQNKKLDANKSKPEPKPKQNGGIASFLTKSSKSSSIAETIDVKKENTETKSMDSEKKNDLKEEINTTKVKEKSGLFDSDTDEEVVKDEKLQSKPAKNDSKAGAVQSNQNKKKPSKKKDTRKSSNDNSAKKRKRIIVEDSDSDDIFGSDKSDDEVIEPTICEEKEQPPPQTEVKPLQPKNKRRKAITNTYQDEEGFIVTKKEYVYETASEDENEPQNKIAKLTLEKKGSSNSENDISPNKAAKSKKGAKKAAVANQPTLMNFFKKK